MIFLQKNSFAILLMLIYEYIFASEKKKRHGKQAEVLGKGLEKDINRCF